MQDLFEALFRIVFGVVFEILLKGPGWLILRVCFPDRDFNPDGTRATLLGIAFWCVIGLGIWLLFWIPG